MTTTGTVPAVAMRGVGKQFPGVKALDDVSLTLQSGRMLALVGENGAGKSTLMSILAGVSRPDCGEIRIEGVPVRFGSTRDARERGVAAIFQELSLAGNLSVAENIFMGREPCTQWGSIDYPRMNRAAGALLRRMGLDVLPETPVGSLRVAQQQVVEIARAISIEARVLIMDEPTSALGREETDSLLRLIAELKGHGVAILYITHKFEELADLADDIAIMRDGKLLAQVPFHSISQQEIVRLMVGRQAAAFVRRTRDEAAASTVLAISNLSLRHPDRPAEYLVRQVSLEVARGEIVGLFGLVGAGRTELLETIFGAHGAPAGGEIRVAGHQVAIRSPAQAIAAGLALVPEDRKHDGLVLGMSSRENAGLACMRARSRYGVLSRRSETAHIKPMLERLRLKTHSLEQPVVNLSGGNQQKVVLAKWLSTQPKVLLLDEPTRGIDICAKNELYGLIQEFAAEGLGVLLASSELPEVLALCDRIIVMCEGAKTGEFARGAATAEMLLQAALPRHMAGGSQS